MVAKTKTEEKDRSVVREPAGEVIRGHVDPNTGMLIREDDPAAHPLTPVAPGGATPMAMIAEAVRRGVDPDELDKLMALEERWTANEARRAFAAAFARFKRANIEIIKNHHVGFESKTGGAKTDYHHATLDNVCGQIIEALGKEGIAHSWRPKVEGSKITVSTVLRHEMGHEEVVTLEGEPDLTGNKNKIQAVGSTITYLQRYGLLSVTGLATKGQDDDGRGAGNGSGGIPETELVALKDMIAGAATSADVAEAWKSSVRACEKALDWTAYATLKTMCGEKSKALKEKK